MSLSFIHRALAVGAILLAVYGYFGGAPEPDAYYMKLAAFSMIVFAVVVRVIERKKGSRN